MATSAASALPLAATSRPQPSATAFKRVIGFLKAVHEVLAEAQELRRRAHQHHPFVDF